MNIYNNYNEDNNFAYINGKFINNKETLVVSEAIIATVENKFGEIPKELTDEIINQSNQIINQNKNIFFEIVGKQMNAIEKAEKINEITFSNNFESLNKIIKNYTPEIVKELVENQFFFDIKEWNVYQFNELKLAERQNIDISFLNPKKYSPEMMNISTKVLLIDKDEKIPDVDNKNDLIQQLDKNKYVFLKQINQHLVDDLIDEENNNKSKNKKKALER